MKKRKPISCVFITLVTATTLFGSSFHSTYVYAENEPQTSTQLVAQEDRNVFLQKCQVAMDTIVEERQQEEQENIKVTQFVQEQEMTTLEEQKVEKSQQAVVILTEEKKTQEEQQEVAKQQIEQTVVSPEEKKQQLIQTVLQKEPSAKEKPSISSLEDLLIDKSKCIVPVTDADIEILIRTVVGEAGGGNIKSRMQAVANVIIHRYEQKWGAPDRKTDTITDIIQQECQFYAYWHPDYDGPTPAYLGADISPEGVPYQAVKAALYGEDLTDGALSFPQVDEYLYDDLVEAGNTICLIQGNGHLFMRPAQPGEKVAENTEEAKREIRDEIERLAELGM